jgi:histone deacetylase 1/2
MTSKPRVTYYFDNEIGIYQYSYSHPMKPLRVAITDRIVQSYGLYSKMKIYVFFIPDKLSQFLGCLFHKRQ